MIPTATFSQTRTNNVWNKASQLASLPVVVRSGKNRISRYQQLLFRKHFYITNVWTLVDFIY